MREHADVMREAIIDISIINGRAILKMKQKAINGI
jgi:hypothetical protein